MNKYQKALYNLIDRVVGRHDTPDIINDICSAISDYCDGECEKCPFDNEHNLVQTLQKVKE